MTISDFLTPDTVDIRRQPVCRMSCGGLAAILLLAATAATHAEGLAKATTWNEQRAAHLLRRAGFGGSPADIKALTAKGLDGAVGFLVDFDTVEQTDPAFRLSDLPDRRKLRKSIRQLPQDERREMYQHIRAYNRARLQEFRAWWVRRMTVSPRPFEEKMTLFWHGHFTSGAQEVKQARWMIEQNQTLREHAVGDFESLVKAICRDPAMLMYLNGNQNKKAHPNENFARELMELFTLGAGNYSEKDIQEAARAFTGWSAGQEGFVMRRRQHDYGKKTLLGKTGRLNGDDIVEQILKQPACSKFLAEKLLAFFVHPQPPRSLVLATAARLRSNNYNIRETMRAVFKSEAFYATDVMHNQIKSPPEFVVGTVRALELDPQQCDFWSMAGMMGRMGQELLQPPNVKGWDGGEKWINAATLVQRQRFVGGVLGGLPARQHRRRVKRMEEIQQIKDELEAFIQKQGDVKLPPLQVELVRQQRLNPIPLIKEKRDITVGAVIDELSGRLFGQTLDQPVRAALAGAYGGVDQRVSLSNKPRDQQKLLQLMGAIMSLPESHIE